MGLLEAAPDAILLVREGGSIALVNRMAERIFGYERTELVGQPVHLLVPDVHRAAHAAAVANFEQAGRIRIMGDRRRLEARRKNGSTFPVEIALSPVDVGTGKVTIAIVRDITHRVELEDRLRHASTHDALTGLFNRAHLDDERPRLEAEGGGGVILVDVDGLKYANDTHGHAAGDQLLKRTAIVLRDAAGPTDLVGRLGGDEFVMLCPGADDASMREAARRVRERLAHHNELHNGGPLSFSLGTALVERIGGFARAMRVADQRMLAEKRQKRVARGSLPP